MQISKTNSIVSKDIIWDSTKKFLYTELDTNIYKINHFFSAKEKGFKFTNYIKSTFLRIYLNELFEDLTNLALFTISIPLFLINKILQIKLIPKKLFFDKNIIMPNSKIKLTSEEFFNSCIAFDGPNALN